jgi:drug/metabolite transporter (DMT)-like permease
VASGFTFAFYMVYAEMSSLRRVHYVELAFVICAAVALCSGVYGWLLPSGGLSFGLSLKAWVYALIIALLVSLVAVTSLQLGIKYTGATMASILLTFEPVTSVICGVIFLGESLSLVKIAGCVCIIASVVLVTLAEAGSKQAPFPSDL